MSANNFWNGVKGFFSNMGQKISKSYKTSKAKRKQKGKKSIGRVIWSYVGKGILTLLLIMIISGSIIGTTATIYIVKDLDKDINFDLNSLKISLTSVIYVRDDNGDFYEYQKLHGSENREWVSYNNINDYVKNGIVAIEDQRFYQHHGVDWKSTVYAFANMFLKMSNNNRGGSTITQQLIKNITNENEATPERKLKEIFRALELEKKYTKEEILESYLNVVSFGNGCNGIQSAAQTYFGKNANELTLAEAACIVGITKNPSKYNPLVNPNNNRERRQYVLKKMLELGFISQQEYDQAYNQELVFNKKSIGTNNTTTKYNSYYVDQVITDVMADLQENLGISSTEAFNMVYNGGLQIYTEVDLKMQQKAEKIFTEANSQIFGKGKSQASPQCAIVVMDYNGAVKCMVGGVGEKKGNRVLNRATGSKRQPGSAIKPLSCYALGIETNAFEFSTMVEDKAININGYKPKNSYKGYKGDITIAQAIKVSSNTVPVQLVHKMGVSNSFNFMTKNLGLDLVDEKEINGKKYTDKGLSSTLGSLTDGVTVLEMTAAYATFGNGGKYYEPYTYSKVLDSNGRVILENKATYTQAMSEASAYIMNQLLREPTKTGGTAAGLSIGNFPIYGKTGTTDNYKDRYFAGGSPYYVAACWYGYDIPKSISGSTNYAMRAWKAVMTEAHEDLPKKDFKMPKGVVKKTYCTHTGLLASPECSDTKTGYYKTKSKIGLCSGHGHSTPDNTDKTTTTTAGEKKTTTTTTTAAEPAGNDDAA
ncbi:MAG: PBP1A family penicillin-binding protein [Clostridia bacterium]|nr:PBP1A family penicillin-binding protein [Clostridia bacterium]